MPDRIRPPGGSEEISRRLEVELGKNAEYLSSIHTSINSEIAQLKNLDTSLTSMNQMLTQHYTDLSLIHTTLSNSLTSLLQKVSGSLPKLQHFDQVEGALGELKNSLTSVGDTLFKQHERLDQIRDALSTEIVQFNSISDTLEHQSDKFDQMNTNLGNQLEVLDSVKGSLSQLSESAVSELATLGNVARSLESNQLSLTSITGILTTSDGHLEGIKEGFDTQNKAIFELNTALSSQIEQLNQLGSSIGELSTATNILSPVSKYSQGQAVRDLQNGLKSVGFELPVHETDADILGTATRDALIQFQKDQSLTVSGIYDSATQSSLKDATICDCIVEGRIVCPDGTLAKDVTVNLYSMNLKGERGNQLGSYKTDSRGFYSILYSGSNGKKNNIQIITEKDGNEVALCNPIYNLGQRSELNLIVPRNVSQAYSDTVSEFTSLNSDLSNALGDYGNLTDAKEDPNHKQLSALRESTGWNAKLIALASSSQRMSGEIQKMYAECGIEETAISTEVLYGLTRCGMPRDLDSLAGASLDEFEAALKKASNAKIIQLDASGIEQAKSTFKTFARTRSSTSIAPGAVSTHQDILVSTSWLDPDKLRVVDDLVFSGISGDELWQKARKHVTETETAALKLQGKLGYLTQNNAPLMSAVQKEIMGNSVPLATEDNLMDASRLVDFGFHHSSKWTAILSSIEVNSGVSKEALTPVVYKASNSDKSFESYTEDMARMVRISFPTKVVAHEISSEDGILSVGNDTLNKRVGGFISMASTMGMDLGKQSIGGFLRDNPLGGFFEMPVSAEELQQVEEEAKRVQRMYMLTPDLNSLNSVLKCGFRSAMEIAEYTREDFGRLYAKVFDTDAIADLVFRRAVDIKFMTYSFFGIVKHLESTPAISVLLSSEKKLAVREGLLDIYPNMEALFGSVDYCECDHARSVLSAAAYLVDILKMLDPSEDEWKRRLEGWKNQHDGVPYPYRNLDEIDEAYTPGEAIPSTPYQVLIKRRPDLAKLELTSENTCTVLPYIDIVNEILEAFICNDGKSEASLFNSGDETEEELIAQPKNVRIEAYRILNESLYPFELPFDIWAETVRELLDHSDLSLADILRHYVGDELFASAEDSELGILDLCCESLDFSPFEKRIFTDWEQLKNWYELYGYESSDEAFADLSSEIDSTAVCAKTLSRRLGVSYKELDKLVKLPCFLKLMDDKYRFYLNYSGAGCDFGKVMLCFAEDSTPTGKAMGLLMLNLIIRLWRKFEIPMTDLSEALESLFPSSVLPLKRLLRSSSEKTANAFASVFVYLDNAINILELSGRDRNSLTEILPLWGKVLTSGKKSPFHRLFIRNNDHENARFFSKVMVPSDTSESVSLGDCLTSVQGIMGKDSDDIEAILSDIGVNSQTPASVENLSGIYRYCYLSDLLDLPVPQLIALKNISGINPFAHLPAEPLEEVDDDPTGKALLFAQFYKTIEDSPLDIPSISYLLKHEYDPVGQYRFDEDSFQKLQSEVVQAFSAIESALEIPPDDAEINDEMFLNWSSILLTQNNTQILLNHIKNGKSAEATEFLKHHFEGVFKPSDIFNGISGNSKEKEQIRKRRLLSAIRPQLVSVQMVEHLLLRLSSEFECEKNKIQSLICTPGSLKGIEGDGSLLDYIIELLPVDTEEKCDELRNAIIRLKKTVIIAKSIDLNPVEIQYFLSSDLNGVGIFDPNKLPFGRTESESTSSLFSPLIALFKYGDLKEILSPGSNDLVDALLKDETRRCELLAATMRRDVNAFIEAKKSLGLKVSDLIEPMKLFSLYEILTVSGKLGISPSTLSDMQHLIMSKTDVQKRAAIARIIKDAIKARFGRAGWIQIAKSVNDRIRKRKRNALVGYICHEHNFDSVERMFEYFLLDPGMEPVVKTSRLRLAISSVQLFMQRCFLNLEAAVSPAVLNSKHWEWMKQYRVWEANRKIFLYPENWLEPEFRDDKSPLFQALESVLMEGELSQERLEKAFFDYLTGLEEISRLEIVSLYCEENPINQSSNIVHVLARTHQAPHAYYYRSNANRMWTPWIPVPLTIVSNHVVLVKHRGRICIFWVGFKDEFEQQNDETSEGQSIIHKSDLPISKLRPKRIVNLQLSWSSYLNGQWTAPLTNGFESNIPDDYESPYRLKAEDNFECERDVFIHASKEPHPDTGEELAIRINLSFRNASVDENFQQSTATLNNSVMNSVFGYVASREQLSPISIYDHIMPGYGMNVLIPFGVQTFAVDSEKSGNLAFRVLNRNFPIQLHKGTQPVSHPYPLLTNRQKTKYKGRSQLNVEYIDKIITEDQRVEYQCKKTILSNCNRYSAVFSSTPTVLPTPEFGSLLSPFFMQDALNTFFIEPNLLETTITSWKKWIPQKVTPVKPGVGNVEYMGELPVERQWPFKYRIDDLLSFDMGTPWENYISKYAKFGLDFIQDWVTDDSTVIQVNENFIHKDGCIADVTNVVNTSGQKDSIINISTALADNLKTNGMNVVSEEGITSSAAVRITSISGKR